jgi:hypothetical protein
MKPGDIVFHSRLGEGVVIQIKDIGMRRWVCVDFGYIEQFLKIEELRLIRSETPSTDSSADNIAPSPPIQDQTPENIELLIQGQQTTKISNLEARKGIMALRLGQVYEPQIFQLSVGLDSIQVNLDKMLAEAVSEHPKCVLIEGAWGTGKTHALTLLRALARRKWVASASVVMDGLGVCLSDPMQLLEEILCSLSFPNQPQEVGLGMHLRNAVRGGKIPALRAKGTQLIDLPLGVLPPEVFDSSETMSCIENYFCLKITATQLKRELGWHGYYIARPPRIRSSRIADRPLTFTTLIKDWAKFSVVMGASGLLVIIDELDVEYAATTYNDIPSIKRKDLRKALLFEIKAMLDQRVPLLIALASAQATAVEDTANDAVEDIRQNIGEKLIHLKVPQLNESDLKVLFAKLIPLYVEAYPGSEEKLKDETTYKIFNKLLEHRYEAVNFVSRQFVRYALETFDLLTVGNLSFDEMSNLLSKPH